ncbi:hypothetical protein BT96DRAFT_627880 [Gymnopus androsaceus JB14]|uniref:DUF6699 domain-containing protein n=1 Tax=Gymnopus androsaceus JB14 TaxID=1447944 RepID=A0A6A4IA06_9AGAR|nr:hypothetical protein BT96DRAFT_627880 [Gymnopus androsaceus JB14]
MASWYSPSYASQNSRTGPLIFEPPVLPPNDDLRSISRASSRSRSRSPASSPHSAPVIPNPALNSPRLSVDYARSLSRSASPRAPSPLSSPVTPGSLSPSGYQPAFMHPRSRSVTPEIFIPPIETESGPQATDPIPIQEPQTMSNATPWARPYNHSSYPQFSYYPPQPYLQSTAYYNGADMWPPPLLSTPYYTPQVQMPAAYGFSTPFNVSTMHNTPFPSTPMVMGPPTPWVPAMTPWVAGTPAIRVNPRLAPGALKWDLLHHPDQARYVNDFGALKAPKFSDEALTMVSDAGIKVTKVDIISSSHPVLNYWMSIWGPIPLPKHKMFDVLLAIYNYLSYPLSAEETKLLLDTPQNVANARRAKEARARDSWALECVVLREDGYKRIDVIGTHRGFGGILVDKLVPAEAMGENNGEQESKVEVQLTMELSPLGPDENRF